MDDLVNARTGRMKLGNVRYDLLEETPNTSINKKKTKKSRFSVHTGYQLRGALVPTIEFSVARHKVHMSGISQIDPSSLTIGSSSQRGDTSYIFMSIASFSTRFMYLVRRFAGSGQCTRMTGGAIAWKIFTFLLYSGSSASRTKPTVPPCECPTNESCSCCVNSST